MCGHSLEGEDPSLGTGRSQGLKLDAFRWSNCNCSWTNQKTSPLDEKISVTLA